MYSPLILSPKSIYALIPFFRKIGKPFSYSHCKNRKRRYRGKKEESNDSISHSQNSSITTIFLMIFFFYHIIDEVVLKVVILSILLVGKSIISLGSLIPTLNFFFPKAFSTKRAFLITGFYSGGVFSIACGAFYSCLLNLE